MPLPSAAPVSDIWNNSDQFRFVQASLRVRLVDLDGDRAVAVERLVDEAELVTVVPDVGTVLLTVKALLPLSAKPWVPDVPQGQAVGPVDGPVLRRVKGRSASE